MKICHLLIIFTAFAAFTLPAETIQFRSGKVLAAELSTAKITVSNVHPDLPLKIPAEPIYAVVSVKLDDGRSISIFDYTLNAFGSEISCAAIRTGKNFNFTIDPVSSDGVIQLLFIADKTYVGKLADNVLTLKSKLPPANDIYSTEIPFSVIGNKAVMSIKAVPAAGSFKAAKENK